MIPTPLHSSTESSSTAPAVPGEMPDARAALVSVVRTAATSGRSLCVRRRDGSACQVNSPIIVGRNFIEFNATTTATSSRVVLWFHEIVAIEEQR